VYSCKTNCQVVNPSLCICGCGAVTCRVNTSKTCKTTLDCK
jgi:hypothetical protein